MLNENANQIRKGIKSDLSNKVRIISPTDFIQTLLHFPVDDGILFSNVLDAVRKDFHDGKRWKDFQKPVWNEDTLESKSKKSFVNIARAVSRVCQNYAPKDAVGSDWVDCQSKPLGRFSRPDIVQVGASTSSAFRQLSKDLWVATEDEKQKLSSVWWMQIHMMVDVKPEGPKSDEEWEDMIVQLCAYIRQVFREQFDRRFAIALLLCDEELTLWFCDRVGLVGTMDPINIHAKPDVFLNILTAFSMLPAHKLGWDPTMKLYLGSGAEPVPSYTVFQRCYLPTLRWCISMPTEDNRNWREDFITIRALTAPCSYGLCGRASIVWEVIKKEDFERGNFEQVLVLKQAWQPVMDEEAEAFDGVSEARIYEKAPKLCQDRIYSYETMKIANEVVSTQFFRCEWATKTYQQVVETSKSDRDADRSSDILDGKTGRKRTLSDAGITGSSDYNEPFAPYSWIGLPEVTLKDNIFHVDDDIEIQSRVLVRLLMKRRGYPLSYFVDNFELVTALRDAVRDHEIMYDQGILHRDISFNNILICDADDEKDAGMLIDLDGAKYSAKRRAVPLNQETKERKVLLLLNLHENQRSNLDEETTSGEEAKSNGEMEADEEMRVDEGTEANEAFLLYLFRQKQHHKLVPRPDVLSTTLQIFDTTAAASVYLRHVFQSLPKCVREGNGTSIVLTSNYLYWPDKIKQEIPDFSSHKPRLTGTRPFISNELLSSATSLFLRPIHNDVHDMESLFWVLLYICLTLEANKDGMRRCELQQTGAERRKSSLNFAVCELFEKGNTRIRSSCLEHHTVLEEIFKNVHPYFDHLRPLLSKLHRALYLARHHKGVEHYNIHSVVLATLEDTIAELKEHRNDQEIVEAKENRRKKWKALRQVPGADEGSNRPSNIGKYSLDSEAQSDQPKLAPLTDRALHLKLREDQRDRRGKLLRIQASTNSDGVVRIRAIWNFTALM